MSKVDINIQLEEIKKLLCKRCKKRLRELVHKKVTEQLADRFTEKIMGSESINPKRNKTP